MDTINNVELTDEHVYPDENVLKPVLGPSFESYRAMMALFEDLGFKHEWRYYNDGKAWLCKIQKGKKTIVWMSAWKGFMQASVFIPVRLLDDVYALPMSDKVKDTIRETKNVGKTQPCIFEIREQAILADLEQMIQFKMRAK